MKALFTVEKKKMKQQQKHETGNKANTPQSDNK